MISADYHNRTVEEAIQDVERNISKVRMVNGEQEARFITGQGPIQTKVIETLEAHGLEPRIQLSNSGVVICVIE